MRNSQIIIRTAASSESVTEVVYKVGDVEYILNATTSTEFDPDPIKLKSYLDKLYSALDKEFNSTNPKISSV